MRNSQKAPETIEEYIAGFSTEVQRILRGLRKTIKQAAPRAEETISYRMPAFKLDGILVYFAAFKNHIGFYPTSSATRMFRRELAPYDGAKGTVRFPLRNGLPHALIRKIVKFRVNENLKKAKVRSKKEIADEQATRGRCEAKMSAQTCN